MCLNGPHFYLQHLIVLGLILLIQSEYHVYIAEHSFMGVNNMPYECLTPDKLFPMPSETVDSCSRMSWMASTFKLLTLVHECPGWPVHLNC